MAPSLIPSLHNQHHCHTAIAINNTIFTTSTKTVLTTTIINTTNSHTTANTTITPLSTPPLHHLSIHLRHHYCTHTTSTPSLHHLTTSLTPPSTPLVTLSLQHQRYTMLLPLPFHSAAMAPSTTPTLHNTKFIILTPSPQLSPPSTPLSYHSHTIDIYTTTNATHTIYTTIVNTIPPSLHQYHSYTNLTLSIPPSSHHSYTTTNTTHTTTLILSTPPPSYTTLSSLSITRTPYSHQPHHPHTTHTIPSYHLQHNS